MDPIHSIPPKQPDVKTEKSSPITDIPKELKLHILKFLGIKDLGNSLLINRLWTALAADPKRWVEVANNLKINITNPAKAKEEVTKYFSDLQEINKELEYNLVRGFPAAKEIESIKDPVDKNNAIRKFIRENIHDEKLRKNVDSVVGGCLYELTLASFGFPCSEVMTGILKMLLQEEIGVVTKENAKQSGWKPILYLHGSVKEYENFLKFNPNLGHAEVDKVIKYNNLEFAKFLFTKINRQGLEESILACLSFNFEKTNPALLKFLLIEIKVDKKEFLTLLNKVFPIDDAKEESRAKAITSQWEEIQKSTSK